MEIYCNTLNASPAPGAPSLADKICKSDFLDREFTEDVVIQAYVVGLVNNRYSEKKTVPGNGPFEDLYITMDAETKIQSLTLDPASPAYEESYSAICKISCLQAGSQVTLSVSGSDGYTDSASYTIASGQQEGEFTLQVPGAETGVRDVVTVTVTLLSGETLSRSASLVFN